MVKRSFDLNMRKDSSDTDEVAQNGGNPKSVTFEIHHGGCFTPTPIRSYVGGHVSSVNVVDIDEFCLYDLKDMVVKLGYGVADSMYYHFLRSILSLDYGLHTLNVDADVLEMTKYVKDNKIILVYVEHGSSNMIFETKRVGPIGKFKEVEVDADNESEEESDTKENDTSGSDSEDLDYDPKHDEVFDDDEHIVEDVHVSMNNFNFTRDPKHNLSIGDVEVREHDLDVIDYDSFGSELDDGIDSEKRIQLRELRRIDNQKNKGPTKYYFYLGHQFTTKEIVTGRVRKHLVETRRKLILYSLLREYAQELINQNPGTTIRTDVQQEPNPDSPTRTFRRVYVCLGSLKQGFKACGREILGLDGCFMSGPWPGQILIAVGVDANNEIYPVAYAIVEAESKAS
nr:transposase, mutator type [Tanacetum cinerariifolium]